MHGLAVLVAATISTLSLCKTRTEPAVTISDLSSVVLVSWYSDSSFFWMPAIPWSWAQAAHGRAASTARTPLRILIVFIESISLTLVLRSAWRYSLRGKLARLYTAPALHAMLSERNGRRGGLAMRLRSMCLSPSLRNHRHSQSHGPPSRKTRFVPPELKPPLLWPLVYNSPV